VENARFVNQDPPANARKKDVIRVVTTESRPFVCLSHSVWGQHIHWFARRSHECTRDFKTCNGCQRGWPDRFKGYLHVADWGLKWDGFLELTQTACGDLITQASPGRTLRGLRFKVSKTKGGPKGRYLVQVIEGYASDESLIQPLDPIDTLRFLWACKNNSGQPI